VAGHASLFDTDWPTLPGRLYQRVHGDGDVKTQTVWRMPNLVHNVLFLLRERHEGPPQSWLHPFPAFPFHLCKPSCEQMVCRGESSCVLFDMYPNRMVRYPHECCLLERGNETLRMDDPSQPQPQHKHLRRISPGTRSAYAAEQWCQAG
jgi:hypothetical protein